VCIALLSTRLISIHKVESNNSFSKVIQVSQHQLDRNAYNMISGKFESDGAKNEQILVQSVDGALIAIDDEFVVFKI
jgi:hypothetical protein